MFRSRLVPCPCVHCVPVAEAPGTRGRCQLLFPRCREFRKRSGSRPKGPRCPRGRSGPGAGLPVVACLAPGMQTGSNPGPSDSGTLTRGVSEPPRGCRVGAIGLPASSLLGAGLVAGRLRERGCGDRKRPAGTQAGVAGPTASPRGLAAPAGTRDRGSKYPCYAGDRRPKRYLLSRVRACHEECSVCGAGARPGHFIETRHPVAVSRVCGIS